jgi:hypothetical protein
MERNYMRMCLMGLAMLLGAAAAGRAQEPPPVRMMAQEGAQADQSLSVDPTGPIQSGTVADAQIFKQPDLTQIGTQPDLNYGPWFQYERIYFSLHQPPTKQIGDPNEAFTDQTPNDGTTGFMNAGFVWGNRFEGGYTSEDNTGWAFSILKTNNQINSLFEAFPSQVTFINREPTIVLPSVGVPSTPTTPFVPLIGFPFPAYFPGTPDISNIKYENVTRLAGVELMKTFRYPVAHDGGVWTIGGGVRFFQLHDRFDATGESAESIFTTSIGTGLPSGATPPAYGASPGESQTVTWGPAPISWDLGIDNDIVGPQIEIGYEYEKDRLTVDTSFRALFGANFENAAMYGWTGGPVHDTVTELPSTVIVNLGSGTAGDPSNNFFSKSNRVEFAPLGEFRFNAEYKVTRNVSLVGGFTGMLVSGIGRASQRIVYQIPDLQILNGAERQHFFADGVTFGVEVNH